jgi:predicted lipoprotein
MENCFFNRYSSDIRAMKSVEELRRIAKIARLIRLVTNGNCLSTEEMLIADKIGGKCQPYNLILREINHRFLEKLRRNMRFLRRLVSDCGLVMLVVGLLASGCTLATVRPLDPTTGKPIIGNESEQFNASNLASQLWDSQLIPTLQKSATPISTVLDSLEQNIATASETYGHRPGSEQPYSFMVTGTGHVLTVNTASRAGLAQIDVNDDGKPDLTLAVGPVVRGTALRDASPFIDFNQFTNQMEYAAVSNQLNALVTSKVLTPLGDLHGLEDKTVTFYGAFTLGSVIDSDNIIVTPAILTVAG